MYRSSHSMNIDRSQFINSKITNGHDFSGSTTDCTQLLRLLAEHRAELVELAGPRGDRVDSRIAEIEEEIAAPEPDGPAVKSAWKSVQKVLSGGVTAAESVSKINDAIRSLFGA
ncbi:hypothetical protein [Pseudonocardia lacus]|uniref:hypothetical protein n=1 Tax=Pseudonocardia lacus TaxID=2835865 RepID=UPI001BDD8C3C|nr:hypothetical protein [Pseudonocardia lacus]